MFYYCQYFTCNANYSIYIFAAIIWLQGKSPFQWVLLDWRCNIICKFHFNYSELTSNFLDFISRRILCIFLLFTLALTSLFTLFVPAFFQRLMRLKLQLFTGVVVGVDLSHIDLMLAPGARTHSHCSQIEVIPFWRPWCNGNLKLHTNARTFACCKLLSNNHCVC